MKRTTSIIDLIQFDRILFDVSTIDADRQPHRKVDDRLLTLGTELDILHFTVVIDQQLKGEIETTTFVLIEVTQLNIVVPDSSDELIRKVQYRIHITNGVTIWDPCDRR